MFKFERLCFCTQEGNYEVLVNKEGNLPILHLYEITRYDRNLENEIGEGPFTLRLLTEKNPGNFPVIYELQDPRFDKERPRDTFRWRILPAELDLPALDASGSLIHHFSAVSEFPDDTDLSGQQFYYYKKLFAGIDDDLSEEEKEGAIHYGNGGTGHWGINLCHRIRLI